MTCPQDTPLDNVEYLRAFNKKAFQERIPLTGNLDLTHRCNLNCIHCYTGSGKSGTGEGELDTGQWLDIIDQITRAGCLNLVITGGDPMLRPDFPTIYTRAKEKGLLVTVFTNGTLITREIRDLFADLPPRAVEITIYGSGPHTHNHITGVDGSFTKTMTGLDHLAGLGITTRLKTILMKLNVDDFFEMEKLARDREMKFRFDAGLFPTLQGNKSPLKLRINVEKAIELEFSDPNRINEWKAYLSRVTTLPTTDSLYQCGAGRTHFHIDPQGILKPCLLVEDPIYDLKEGDFKTGWDRVISRIIYKKASTDYSCQTCDKRALCGMCPGFFKLENGNEEEHSQFLCAMGHSRNKKLKELLKGG